MGGFSSMRQIILKGFFVISEEARFFDGRRCYLILPDGALNSIYEKILEDSPRKSDNAFNRVC